MKKTAFLHALVLVILLSVSWVLLFLKFRSGPADGMQPQSTTTADNRVEPATPAPGSKSPALADPPAPSPGQDRQPVPPAWTEWIQYLEQQQTGGDMQAALDAMKATLLAMDPDEAKMRLLELILSGVNLQTGLRFRVGSNGDLAGAPDMQTLLLDWLGQLDPVAAADMAKSALARSGESLGPDGFVIHLKNYARGTTDPPFSRDRLVYQYFNRLIANDAWTANPVHSIAESMDFAVFLRDGSIVPALSAFMAQGQSPALGHASSMAIERLVDIDPIGSVSAIVDTLGQPGMSPHARAGFVARVDPAGPGAFELLTGYLGSPYVSQQEAVAFLQFLPNLNKSLSHNLVSPEISITNLGNHIDRMKSALDAVRDWQADPPRTDIGKELSLTGDRLLAQIKGDPLP